MRAAFAKWSEPVLALLPDPRGVPVRKQATVAIVVSALLHLLLLFVIAWLYAVPPPKIQFARPKPKLKPIEIELIPMPREEPRLLTLNEQTKIEYLDSTGLEKAPGAPDIPLFESDQDMIAASENPASGDKPLPSMKGRRDLGFTNFRSQNALIGPTPELFPRDVAITTTAPPAAPIYKPQPVRPDKAQPATPDPPAPEIAQTPPPESLKKVETPGPDEIALPPEKPPTPEPIMPPSKPQPSTELAKLVPPSPKPQDVPKTGYQPNLEQTKIEGSISNRGNAAVDAVRTPLGVYKKQISEAIGSRWHYYVKQRNDLITVGIARVTFFVTKEGRIQNVRVIDNTSNETFSIVCSQSVREAELPAPPAEAFEAMKDGRMEITFTFNLYPN